MVDELDDATGELAAGTPEIVVDAPGVEADEEDDVAPAEVELSVCSSRRTDAAPELRISSTEAGRSVRAVDADSSWVEVEDADVGVEADADSPPIAAVEIDEWLVAAGAVAAGIDVDEVTAVVRLEALDAGVDVGASTSVTMITSSGFSLSSPSEPVSSGSADSSAVVDVALGASILSF